MRPPPPQLLIVDDDEGYSDAVAEVLRSEGGYGVIQVQRLSDAVERLCSEDVAVVVVDHSLIRGRQDGPRLLEGLQRAAGPAAVGLSSGWALGEATAEMQARGLSFLLSKPFDLERLLAVAAEHAAVQPPSEDERRLAHAYFAALQANDWKALGALCTDDVRYHLPGEHEPFCTTVEGRDAFEAFSAETFRHFPDVRFEVTFVHCLPKGGMVARYHCSWRDPSGERAASNGSVILRFDEGGRIREVGVRLAVKELLARYRPVSAA